MPLLEFGADPPFSRVLVKGLIPYDARLYQEAMERLGALGVSAQLMDAQGVAGLDHIRTAAMLAKKSFKAGKNLARSPATELLLYASARRQIKEAIERLGVNSRTCSWVMVSISGSMNALEQCSEVMESYGRPEDSVIAIAAEKKKHLMALFGISSKELALAKGLHEENDLAIEALVIEKVALSDLYR